MAKAARCGTDATVGTGIIATDAKRKTMTGHRLHHGEDSAGVRRPMRAYMMFENPMGGRADKGDTSIAMMSAVARCAK